MLLATEALSGSLLTGCNGCNDKALTTTTGADAGHRTSDQLTPEQQAKVLAKVGDKTITLGDFAAALENMDQFDRLRYQSTERRKELLNEMINVELLAQEAHAKGYDKDPATEQEVRAILRDAMLAEARKSAPTPNDVPESDARAYYDAHAAEYRDPERRRISVFVTKDEAVAKNALASTKGMTAADWGQLVRDKSIDPQAKANVPVDLAGDLGIVSPPGDPRGENTRIPDAVRVALFQIEKPGDVYPDLVKVKDSFYLVRFTHKVDAHNRPFEEAERTIRVKLAQDLARKKEDELVVSLRQQFPVTIDDAALSQVRSDTSDAGALPMLPLMPGAPGSLGEAGAPSVPASGATQRDQ